MDGDAAEVDRMTALFRKLKASNFSVGFTELLYRAAEEGQVQQIKVSFSMLAQHSSYYYTLLLRPCL